MKQSECNALREVQSQIKAEGERHELTLGTLKRKERDIKESCDHKYPNGQSAVQGEFMFSECQICGWNDL